MSLPIFQSDSKDMSLLQTSWAKEINPIITSPQNQSNILKSVPLITGANSVNHLLGRKLQGWKIVRQRAVASVYDTQDTNPFPALTLMLVSSANVICDIEVF